MRRWRALEERWGKAAIIALALLFLAAGFCCLGQDGMDQHGMPVDFCSIALLILAIDLAAGALVLVGLAPLLGSPSFATILLAVPKPPPRRIRFS